MRCSIRLPFFLMVFLFAQVSLASTETDGFPQRMPSIEESFGMRGALTYHSQTRQLLCSEILLAPNAPTSTYKKFGQFISRLAGLSGREESFAPQRYQNDIPIPIVIPHASSTISYPLADNIPNSIGIKVMWPSLRAMELASWRLKFENRENDDGQYVEIRDLDSNTVVRLPDLSRLDVSSSEFNVYVGRDNQFILEIKNSNSAVYYDLSTHQMVAPPA